MQCCLQGPEGFVEAQSQVYKTLEDRFYPSFLVSDTYDKYVGSSYSNADESSSDDDNDDDENTDSSKLRGESV